MSTNYSSIINQVINKPRTKLPLNRKIPNRQEQEQEQEQKTRTTPPSENPNPIDNQKSKFVPCAAPESSRTLQTTLLQNFSMFYSKTSQNLSISDINLNSNEPKSNQFFHFSTETKDIHSNIEPRLPYIFIVLYYFLQLYHYFFEFVTSPTEQIKYPINMLLTISFIFIVLGYLTNLNLLKILTTNQIFVFLKCSFLMNTNFSILHKLLVGEITQKMIYAFQIEFIFLNLFFNSSLEFSIGVHLFNFLLTLCARIYKDTSFITKKKDAFSMIYYFCFCTLTEYFIKSSNSSLMTSYYLYKKNYETLLLKIWKNLPFPNFHLFPTKDILISSDSGKEFCQMMTNIRKLKQQSNNKRETQRTHNFYDYVINEQLFEYIFLKTLSQNTKQSNNFDYPFLPKKCKNKNISQLFGANSMIFSANKSELDWYKIVIIPCIWGNKQCFNLHLIPFRQMKEPIFAQDQITKQRKCLENIIDEIDLCCWKLKELNCPSSTQTKRSAVGSTNLSNVNSSGSSECKSGGYRNRKGKLNENSKFSKGLLSTKLEPKILFRNTSLNF